VAKDKTGAGHLMRELWEMRYLWHVPMRLDNSKLLSILGDEPHTPIEEASSPV
jgi:hypothetical protein